MLTIHLKKKKNVPRMTNHMRKFFFFQIFQIFDLHCFNQKFSIKLEKLDFSGDS